MRKRKERGKGKEKRKGEKKEEEKRKKEGRRLYVKYVFDKYTLHSESLSSRRPKAVGSEEFSRRGRFQANHISQAKHFRQP